MPDAILDGIGSGFTAGVDSERRLMVVGSISSMPDISVGSLSVTAGSVSYIPAGSVIVTNMVAGSIVYMPSVPVSVGSVQVYDPIGVGSVLVTNPAVVGSLSYQNIIPSGTIPVSGNVLVSGTILATQGTSPWVIVGSTNIDNAVSVGSLATQNIIGSVNAIVTAGSFFAIGGSLNVSNMVGSVAITSQPAWTGVGSVYNINSAGGYAGSDAYIPAGSVIVTNMVAGSIVYMPSVSVTTGSDAYIWGKSGTGYVQISVDENGFVNTNASVSAGSVSYIPAGSVIVTNTVGVLGSVNIDNAVSVGSLATQGIIGSVNVTNTAPWSITGSITPYGVGSIYGIGLGSIAVSVIGPATIGSLATQNVVGSVAVTNSLNIATGSVQLFGLSGGAIYPLLAGSTSAGGILRTDATQGTNPWIVLGSTQITNSLLSVSGNVLVSGTVSLNAVATIGSLATQNVIGSVHVTQSTNPWIVLGSVAITNSAGGPGSVTLYDTSGVKLFFDNGRIAGSIHSLPAIVGSVNISNLYAGSDAYIPAGSVIVTNSITMSAGSTWAIGGSINVTNAVGSVAVTSQAVWAGVGSIYGIGVGSVAVAVISPATIGSLATQNIVGSVNVTNPSEVGSLTTQQVVNAAGNNLSVSIFGGVTAVGSFTTQGVSISGTPPIAYTAISDAGFGFSGVTLNASGTVTNIWTPGTGSVAFLKGFTMSAHQAVQARILFSGGTLIDTFNIPGSGTIGMNLLGMEPSGHADGPIGVGLFNNASVHIGIFARGAKP